MTIPTKWPVRPAKTQISLGQRPVWSESSLCAQWIVKDPSILHVDSEDSDQTGHPPKLIWVFAGCTFHFVGFVVLRLNWKAYLIKFKTMIQVFGETGLGKPCSPRSDWSWSGSTLFATPPASFGCITLMIKLHFSQSRIITAFFGLSKFLGHLL